MKLENLIKESPSINLTVKASDLFDFAQSIANQTAQNILNIKDEKVFTREEVILKFSICSATLWRWDKLGLIKGKKIGNRRYYSESEIQRLISQNGGRK